MKFSVGIAGLLMLASLFLPVPATSAIPDRQCIPDLYCQTIDYRRPVLTVDFQNRSRDDLTLVLTAVLDSGKATEQRFTAKRFIRAGQTVEWLRQDIGNRTALDIETRHNRIVGPEDAVSTDRAAFMAQIAGPTGLVQRSVCSRDYYCLYSINDFDGVRWVADKLKDIPIVLLIDISNGSGKLVDHVADLSGPPGLSPLFSLSKEQIGNASLSIRTALHFGYADARSNRNHVYRLPYPSGTRFQVSQGYHSNVTHNTPESQYAIDWAMPEGTPILAARGGIAIDVVDDETRSGPLPELVSAANVVRILHDDGTIATYAHLITDGARVEEGRRVQAGDIIGFSGNTGYSTGPHLHFSVMERRDPHSPLTAIPTLFNFGAGQYGHVEEGNFYRAP